jgi:rubrerythrin
MTGPNFACLALLEDEACQLYEFMVAKSENAGASLLLDEILQESRAHRELFKHAGKIVGNTVSSMADCMKQMGPLFVHSVEFIRTIKNQVSNGMPIIEAVERLVRFEEDAANEEDLTKLYADLTSATTLDTAMKQILEGIAEDEKHHADNLRLILEILRKEPPLR